MIGKLPVLIGSKVSSSCSCDLDLKCHHFGGTNTRIKSLNKLWKKTKIGNKIKKNS
jgi:hypothetical protein